MRSRMLPSVLIFVLVGCATPERRAGELAAAESCWGEGERTNGPFRAPVEYMRRVFDAEQRPTAFSRASDPDFEFPIEHTWWVYGAQGQLVEQLDDGDGDGHVDEVQVWEWSDLGRIRSWTRTNTTGGAQETELYFYGTRRGNLERVWRDLDGDFALDELEDYAWDSDNRLSRLDTWDPDGDVRLHRTTIEYLEQAPRVDRMERIDLDGDNVHDVGTMYRYDLDGMLTHTDTMDGVHADYTWDDDGRLLASITTSALRTETFQASWTEQGLPLSTRTDIDEGNNGWIDDQEETHWVWTCDGSEPPW